MQNASKLKTKHVHVNNTEFSLEITQRGAVNNVSMERKCIISSKESLYLTLLSNHGDLSFMFHWLISGLTNQIKIYNNQYL